MGTTCFTITYIIFQLCEKIERHDTSGLNSINTINTTRMATLQNNVMMMPRRASPSSDAAAPTDPATATATAPANVAPATATATAPTASAPALATPTATAAAPNTPIYTRRVTPEQMAEESRIATAQGLRDIAAALAAKGLPSGGSSKPQRQDDDGFSSSDDSSDGSRRGRSHGKRRRRRNSGDLPVNYKSNADEKAAYLLRVELASVMVEKDDLSAEIRKFQNQLLPYSNLNNELALIKSAIDRLNKDTSEQTIAQLEKRQWLFREEFAEHKALATVASSKITYAEVKSCALRVIAAEVKRSGLEDKKLTLTIWYRKSTETTTKVFISSVLIAILSYLLYWYFKKWF